MAPKGIVEAGYEAWKSRPAPPEVRCPLVNPLCPNDLCILEANHPGTEQGWHTLGTDPYDQPHRYIRPGSKNYVLFLHPDGPGVSDADLIAAGADRARELEGLTHGRS